MEKNKKHGVSLGQVLVLVLCAGILVKCIADNSAEKARKQAVEQALMGVIRANENAIKRLESNSYARRRDPDEFNERPKQAEPPKSIYKELLSDPVMGPVIKAEFERAAFRRKQEAIEREGGGKQ